MLVAQCCPTLCCSSFEDGQRLGQRASPGLPDPSAFLAHFSILTPQAALFAEAGVSKIRLTGGEPTLRRDIVELTGALAALPGVSGVGITTNGIALQRKLAALQANGERGVSCS